jgi:hypothetical protein
MVDFLTEILPAGVQIFGFSLARSLAPAALGGFTPASSIGSKSRVTLCCPGIGFRLARPVDTSWRSAPGREGSPDENASR